jgi:hypothetical protein
MKQKLTDLKLKLQRDRKTQAIAITAVVILMLFFVIDSKNAPPRTRPSIIPDQQMVRNNQNLRANVDESNDDLLRRFTSDLTEIKDATIKNAEDNKKIKTELSTYEQRTAEIFKRVLERIQETENSSGRGGMGGPGVEAQAEGAAQDAGMDPSAQAATDEIESFGGVNETHAAAPPPVKDIKVARVSPGDSVRVKLLAGVNAPTDGTPYPVVFQLVSDVDGPDGSTLPLGQARLVAAAQGSLVDSRALFRLTTLSVQFPNGRRKEVEVDGWIVGEDGIRGMAGVTLDPIGKAIGGGILAGGIQGIGEGFSMAQLTTNQNTNGNNQQLLTGDVGTYAAGRGLSGGAQMWAGMIKERVALLVPQVQVMSGREGTAVFASPFSLKGLFEAMGEDDNALASMD